ncbi:4-hydroxythreonine-4-phosphate dehydrogenase [Mariprofundus micogutta]|uniref:4-hydroxythreonine-4-phosphate dehydrogenase n=1 Tax=Mariprofundus micogutta TaxID=1921010 RepID=A0A1L8CM23_9PROT|nr:4-hydroxythreonine-4-phosphate dehydrogenase PdxA [Mariprofundus micogutta]GAV19954.1 4-hydroxythreonine-4-phosphate dehydrogenase [Mariprofundus micogutta]
MKPLLLTLGEPGGIGPDCIIRAYKNRPELFDHIIIVTPGLWMEQRATQIDIPTVIFEFSTLNSAIQAKATGLRCWNPVPSHIATGPVVMGKTSQMTAMAVICCIQTAAESCLARHAAGMITGPIEKAVLRSAGFNFPGHTEFLAHLSRQPQAEAETDFVMMLASASLRVALLTTHLAIKHVPETISMQATIDCIRIVQRDLIHRFGIPKPRLALCGLNPHAGEQGHFGREEIEILMPAAESARLDGIDVTDPLPADTAFSATNRHNFDAIICCYHDQALIPIKAISFGESVNVTLGLPFIRTSVDHGTALDLAGSEDVSYSSLVEAIEMAITMAQKASS